MRQVVLYTHDPVSSLADADSALSSWGAHLKSVTDFDDMPLCISIYTAHEHGPAVSAVDMHSYTPVGDGLGMPYCDLKCMHPS